MLLRNTSWLAGILWSLKMSVERTQLVRQYHQLFSWKRNAFLAVTRLMVGQHYSWGWGHLLWLQHVQRSAKKGPDRILQKPFPFRHLFSALWTKCLASGFSYTCLQCKSANNCTIRAHVIVKTGRSLSGEKNSLHLFEVFLLKSWL